MTSKDFVPLADRRSGLHLRTYQVDAEGHRHNVSQVVRATPEPGPHAVSLDFWPDCTCPRHRAD